VTPSGETRTKDTDAVRWFFVDVSIVAYQNEDQPVKRRRALLASNPIKE
jgi:hypothetical protein